MRYLEKEKRERIQQAAAKERAIHNVTTDVQTSLLGTPRTMASLPGTPRTAQSSKSRSTLAGSANNV